MIAAGRPLRLHDASARPHPHAGAVRGVPLHGHQLPPWHPAVRQGAPRHAHLSPPAA
jgi:hypothetical protein